MAQANEARGPRSFDPVRLGSLECDAWASYYRRDWPGVLRASVGMVHVGFGMGPFGTLVGAWHVLRGNQLWAPYPDNDPEGARSSMRRFYALVAGVTGASLDPVEAARLEVEWWRVHREHQHDPGVPGSALARALTDLYAYVYDVAPDAVREAAQLRTDAMDLSDAWVVAGCHLEDPLLARERETLVASYTSLRRAVAT